MLVRALPCDGSARWNIPRQQSANQVCCVWFESPHIPPFRSTGSHGFLIVPYIAHIQVNRTPNWTLDYTVTVIMVITACR